MAGISIDFAADVTKFIGKTKDIEGALEKVSGSLDEMAREAKQAGDKAADGLDQITADGAVSELRDLAAEAKASGSKLELVYSAAADEVEASMKAMASKSEDRLEEIGDAAKGAGKDLDKHLTAGAKDAETAAERLESTFKDAFDKVSGEAKRSGDDVGNSTKRGFDRAKDGVEDFRDEANSTAREAAASFDGSAASITDAFQEVAANAFAGFGPAGAVAGLAAAAGIGIVTSKMEEAKERAQEAAEEIAEIAGELIDLGQSKRGPQEVDDALKAAATTAEDGQNQLAKWAETAETAGIDTATFLRGMAGDSAAATASLAELDERRAEYTKGLEETKAQNEGSAGALNAFVQAAAKQNAAVDDASTGLREQNDIMEEGAEVTGLYSEAIDGSAAALEREAEAQRISREERERANGATRSLFDAETKYAETLGVTTSAIGANADGISTNTEQGRANRDALMGLSAAALAQAQAMGESGKSTQEVSGFLETARTDFITAAEAAGLTAQEAGILADQLLGVPKSVATDITSNAAEVIGDVVELATKIRNLPDGSVRITTTYSDGTARSSTAQMNSGGMAKRAASGTYVTGEGSDIEDRVPYLLSPGEYVLDKQATDQVGPGVLDILNNGQSVGGKQLTPIASTPTLTAADMERFADRIVAGVLAASQRVSDSTLAAQHRSDLGTRTTPGVVR